ncbi:MAG: DISARM system phospholipase D-like protein DrmC [Humibacillus sp.]|nr:DISARM system phospholipase D-like protein DrmC [Humibacillus sp.]MDN5775643.1 DISARM system phospholipase D-like protein DrmC [Humibacillus sp.]
MTGDLAACRELAAYLTGSEANELAIQLDAGRPFSIAIRAVSSLRRQRVRDLLERIGGVDTWLPVLAAIEGAHARAVAIEAVWTAPGNLVQYGSLGSSVHHYVKAARESVICSTFNFQESSALWSALATAAARTELDVRIYMDRRAADWHKGGGVPTPTTQEVANTLVGATVLRTKKFDGSWVRNHAKFLAIDHQFLLVTSANFSKSAEHHNVELGLVVRNPSLTQAIETEVAGFERNLYEVVRRQ